MIDLTKFGMEKVDYLLEVDCFPLHESKISCSIKGEREHFIIPSYSLSDFVRKFDFSQYLVSFRPLDVFSFKANSND